MTQPRDAISFKTNYNNKLSCPNFLTIQMSGRFEIGQKVQVILQNKVLGNAICRSKKEISFWGISDSVALLDTGFDANETRVIIRDLHPKNKFEADTTLFFYVFSYVKQEKVSLPKLF